MARRARAQLRKPAVRRGCYCLKRRSPAFVADDAATWSQLLAIAAGALRQNPFRRWRGGDTSFAPGALVPGCTATAPLREPFAMKYGRNYEEDDQTTMNVETTTPSAPLRAIGTSCSAFNCYRAHAACWNAERFAFTLYTHDALIS